MNNNSNKNITAFLPKTRYRSHSHQTNIGQKGDDDEDWGDVEKSWERFRPEGDSRSHICHTLGHLSTPKTTARFNHFHLNITLLHPISNTQDSDLKSFVAEDGCGVEMLFKKCCVSDFKINECTYYKLKTLIEQRQSFLFCGKNLLHL